MTIAAVIVGVGAAWAQQRPLTTEDPETVGEGRLLVEVGAEYGHDQKFSPSGLTGNLWRLPVIGFSVGVSSIAEIQVDMPLYDRFSITSREPAPLAELVDATGDVTTDIGDMVIGTKLRLLSEAVNRPSIGLRLATKLPTSSNESGIGLDTMDFFATALVGKTTGSVRIVGNVGVGLLSDPLIGGRQTDALTYGASVARAVSPGFEVVGEATGRFALGEADPSVGTEARTVLKGGARFTRGAGRVDGAIIIGATARDPGIGFTFGYTHVFNAVRVP